MLNVKYKDKLFITLCLCMNNIYAAMPTAPSELTDNTDNWIKGIISFCAPIFVGGLFAVTGAGSITMLTSAWSAFEDARRHGDWKSFGSCLSVGLVLLGVTVFMVNKFKDIFVDILQ